MIEEDDMANAIAIGWRTGKIVDFRDFVTAAGARFIKVFVEVDDRGSTLRASCLCKPVILPGGDLYKWIRVCNIPLAAIDNTVKPALFIGKPVKVHVAQNGDYFNITDVKTIEIGV